jgi:MinD superfamily P-loop ATPase
VLTDHFGLAAAIIVNTADLCPGLSERLFSMAREAGAAGICKLPFDPAVPRALAAGRLPLEIEGFERAIRTHFAAVVAALEVSPSRR